MVFHERASKPRLHSRPPKLLNWRQLMGTGWGQGSWTPPPASRNQPSEDLYRKKHRWNSFWNREGVWTTGGGGKAAIRAEDPRVPVIWNSSGSARFLSSSFRIRRCCHGQDSQLEKWALGASSCISPAPGPSPETCSNDLTAGLNNYSLISSIKERARSSTALPSLVFSQQSFVQHKSTSFSSAGQTAVPKASTKLSMVKHYLSLMLPTAGAICQKNSQSWPFIQIKDFSFPFFSVLPLSFFLNAIVWRLNPWSIQGKCLISFLDG